MFVQKPNPLKYTLSYAGHLGIILSLSAASIAYTASVFYGVTEPNLALLTTVFLMIFAVYRINKVLDLKEDAVNFPERARFIHNTKSLRKLLLPSVVCYVVALALAFSAGFWVFTIVLFSIFWIVFYSIDLPPAVVNVIGFNKIKAIPVVKSVYASVAWATIPLITAFFLNKSISAAVLVMIAFVFLRLLTSIIAFDIKDIAGDKKFGIKTIPVLVGKARTIVILLALNAFSAFFLFCATLLHYVPPSAHAVNFITFYGFYYIFKLMDPRADVKFLSNVVIDGEFIFWTPLAYLGVLFF